MVALSPLARKDEEIYYARLKAGEPTPGTDPAGA